MVLYDLSEELNIWGYSSAGRALEWHSRGRGFESHYLHFRETLVNVGFFLYLQGFCFCSLKKYYSIKEHVFGTFAARMQGAATCLSVPVLVF